MILKSLMDGTKNLVQDKVSLSEHQIPRAEEGMTLSLSFFKKKPALLFLFSNFSFLPFIHFWKPYPPHFQWFHWRWPICMTFKDRRLGTWVRSAVALDEWKSQKSGEYKDNSTPSLQELLAELTNDKCTLDKPTFISIYFYACAWWCSWIS